MSHRSTTYRAPSPLQVVVDGVNSLAFAATVGVIASGPVIFIGMCIATVVAR